MEYSLETWNELERMAKNSGYNFVSCYESNGTKIITWNHSEKDFDNRLGQIKQAISSPLATTNNYVLKFLTKRQTKAFTCKVTTNQPIIIQEPEFKTVKEEKGTSALEFGRLQGKMEYTLLMNQQLAEDNEKLKIRISELEADLEEAEEELNGLKDSNPKTLAITELTKMAVESAPLLISALMDRLLPKENKPLTPPPNNGYQGQGNTHQ